MTSTPVTETVPSIEGCDALNPLAEAELTELFVDLRNAVTRHAPCPLYGLADGCAHDEGDWDDDRHICSWDGDLLCLDLPEGQGCGDCEAETCSILQQIDDDASAFWRLFGA